MLADGPAAVGAVGQVFGEPGEAFHNTFVFDPSAREWKWRMDAEHQGTLQPFARVRLTRVAQPDR